mgnify:FL=1
MNLKNKTAALVLAALMLLPTAVTNAAASDVRESALSVEDIPTVTQGETLFYTVTLGSEETEFSFKTESLYKPVANTFEKGFALYASLYKVEADGTESAVVQRLRVDCNTLSFTFKNLAPATTYRLKLSRIMPTDENRIVLPVNSYDYYWDGGATEEKTAQDRKNLVMDRVFGKHVFDENDERPITRAEAARFFYILYTADAEELPAPCASPIDYADLTSENEPAYSYIQFLSTIGIFKGNTEGRVRPYDYLTDREAWVMFVRFAEKEHAVPQSGYPFGYLSVFSNLGLLQNENYSLDRPAYFTLREFALATERLLTLNMDFPVAYDAESGLTEWDARDTTEPYFAFTARKLNALELLTKIEWIYDERVTIPTDEE